MQFKLASVDSFIIEFSQHIDLAVSKKVKFYFERILKFEHVIDLTPSYTTLLVHFDIFKTSFEAITHKINAIDFDTTREHENINIIEVPVYYGEEVSLDALRICTHHNISKEELIALHTKEAYTVFAIGFAPGFAYLGEVPSKIAMNRLATPRKRIAKGSVAIADTQTAIYPQASPAGWNVIGRTVFEMFDTSLSTLCPVSMGDKVQFKSISKEEYIASGGEF
jgi:KipI family sensor histidine kinase inhibitor